jgi:hypothetical protein
VATVTNSIGTASRDYSTIALWEAALPASAVTAGNSYVGQCYNDSEFTAGATFAGTTTDATHTITLTTGPGQSFRDNAGAATNPLRYDQSKGVGIAGNVSYATVFDGSDQYVTISNLQIKNLKAEQGTHALWLTGANSTIDSCIFETVSGSTANATSVVVLGGSNSLIQNCVAVPKTSSAVYGIRFVATGSAINCTIARPTNFTAGGNGIAGQYNAITVQNCVIVGFTTPMLKGGSNAVNGSGNATDQSSFGTSIAATGQTSLTATTEFENPSNASSVMDWRLKSTSVKCLDNGTNSGAPSTDIIGQAISNTTRDTGAWEYQQGGGASGPVGSLYTVRQSIQRASYW